MLNHQSTRLSIGVAAIFALFIGCQVGPTTEEPSEPAAAAEPATANAAATGTSCEAVCARSIVCSKEWAAEAAGADKSKEMTAQCMSSCQKGLSDEVKKCWSAAQCEWFGKKVAVNDKCPPST
jgi:Cys-rich protein (TIGR04453 family)